MILDRIEGETAILELESGACIKLPVSLLPKDAKEGDVLVLAVDTDAAQQSRQTAKKRMNRLFCD